MEQNSICRACLKTDHKLFNIFTHYCANKLIFDILVEYASIRVEKADTLPETICDVCFERLTAAYDFKLLIVESDRKLRSEFWPNLSNREAFYTEPMLLKAECETTVIDTECILTSDSTNDSNMGNSEKIDLKQEIKEVIILDQIVSYHKDVSNDEEMTKKTNNKENANKQISTTKLSSKQHSILVNHKKYNGKKEREIYSCQQCGKSYKALRNFKTHKLNCKVQKISKLCDTKISNTDLSNIKILKSDSENKKSNQNEHCGKLEAETRSVSKKCIESIKQNYCEECDKYFRSNYCFKAHTAKHTGIKPYKCEDCNKSYAEKWLLKVHSRVHTDYRPYTCAVCGKKFKFSNALPIHMRSHTGEQPYKCEVCNRSFSQMGAVKVHMKTHTGEKPFVCEICGRGFAEKAILRRHTNTHDGLKNHPCPTCGKLFLTETYLKTHLKRHTNAKPYACEVCKKRFTVRTSLKTHMLIHSGEKPHSCHLCGKKFTQLSCISRHMRIHTGETPYPCTLCSQSFKYSHHLQNHMKVHRQQ